MNIRHCRGFQKLLWQVRQSDTGEGHEACTQNVGVTEDGQGCNKSLLEAETGRGGDWFAWQWH